MNQKFALKAAVLAFATAFVVAETNAQAINLTTQAGGNGAYTAPSIVTNANVSNNVDVHIVLNNVVEFKMYQDWALLEYKTASDYQTGVEATFKQFNITSNTPFDLSVAALGATFNGSAGNTETIPVGDVEVTPDLLSGWNGSAGNGSQNTTTNTKALQYQPSTPQVILSANGALQDDLAIKYSTKNAASQRDFQIHADDYKQTVTFSITQK